MLLFSYLQETEIARRKDLMEGQMTTDTTEIERRSISMYSDQWRVIDEINEQYGIRNVSITLRYIVNEYLRLRSVEQQIAQPEAGR